MTIYRPSVTPPADLSLEEMNATLHRYCLSLTNSSWDSDDLVQDTWIKALEHMKNRSHVNPEALLLRIAKNTWIDRVRRDQTYRRILDEKLEQVLPREETSNEDSKLNIEFAFQWLREHLSPLQRTVLLLREVYEYSVSETAVKLKTTEGAVKAALHRAHKVLQSMDPEEEELILTMPEEEEMTLNLRALAEAYQSGDVEAVVRLIQWNSSEASAIGCMVPMQVQTPSASYMTYGGYSSDMRMAA
ncbi:sigma-70 family RNA polymerase sigma factor [Paenibacillus lautus]|uniref:sigma-70 family RNA polymerase sigma factor n=1 Tax=Paenibacillus lautus TaxID=1401 RepID=UPI002DBD9E5B|nr:sigma-70 family RNA polymerase sigma factor [Paenibacillus lautus]MEC0308183.1 sigma-70 family RNA polymerase sigma factor [Paenibacillus lautus]